jgi:hypothetical protein
MDAENAAVGGEDATVERAARPKHSRKRVAMGRHTKRVVTAARAHDMRRRPISL